MARYSQDVKDYIANNVKGATNAELVELVNAKFNTRFTNSKMKSYKANHSLQSGTQCGTPKGQPSYTFPEEVRNYIVDNHKTTGHKGMAEQLFTMFGRAYAPKQIKAYYANHKMHCGRSGHFEKGHTPINKGKPGNAGWKSTQFKAEHRPHNYQLVGTERINGSGYVDIKVAEPNTWKGKHIIVWEQTHGPVPDGSVIVFGDRNRRNFDPNNLILVTRSQLSTLNVKGLIQTDADLTRTALIIVDIMHASKKARKNTTV